MLQIERQRIAVVELIPRSSPSRERSEEMHVKPSLIDEELAVLISACMLVEDDLDGEKITWLTHSAAVFEKTCATTQNRKKSCFLDFEKKTYKRKKTEVQAT